MRTAGVTFGLGRLLLMLHDLDGLDCNTGLMRTVRGAAREVWGWQGGGGSARHGYVQATRSGNKCGEGGPAVGVLGEFDGADGDGGLTHVLGAERGVEVAGGDDAAVGGTASCPRGCGRWRGCRLGWQGE